MNIIKIDELKTKEDYVKKLKYAVSLRNQMGGTLYYEILNEYCSILADICMSKGCNTIEIANIFYYKGTGGE
jgi:hypothetical protein